MQFGHHAPRVACRVRWWHALYPSAAQTDQPASTTNTLWLGV